MRTGPGTYLVPLAACVMMASTSFGEDLADNSELDLQVDMERCQNANMGNLLANLNIEAMAFSPALIGWMKEEKIQIRVTCAEDIFEIRVVEPESERFLERRVTVDEAVSMAMSRYIAVALAELIDAGKDELAPQAEEQVKASVAKPEPGTRQLPAPPAPPPTFKPAPTPRQAPKESTDPQNELELRLILCPSIWVGGRPKWLSYGGAAGLELQVNDWLVPALDLGFHGGPLKVDDGYIGAFQFSGAFILLFRLPVHTMSLMLGVGFHLGLVSFEGRPASEGLSGQREELPWHAPVAQARAAFPVGKRMEMGLFMEVGGLSMEAHANVDGRDAMSLESVFVRLGILGKVKLF